jgi:nucleotide-binding universal stress UspA family protein
MTSRWIVGIDGSETAVDALRWAARHAVGRDAELTALGAFHVPAYLALFTAKRGFGVDEVGIGATTAHEIDEALERVAADVEPGQVTVQPLVVEGQAAHALVEAAADADLLVVGRRGTNDLRDHVFGSVSRYCVTHSAAPVVVVPTGWTTPSSERLVVGFDGSPEASAAVRWAFDFAGEQAAITIVSAIDVAPWVGADLTRERFPDEVAAEEARIAALLDAVDPDGRARRVIAVHSPRQVLAEAMGETDLMVLGAVGSGRASGLGSVSTWSLHNATVPVTIVPVS